MTADGELEEKKASVERERTATLEYARQVHGRYMAETSAAKEYAVVCLRSLLFLNGGAIVATFGGRSASSTAPLFYIPRRITGHGL